MKWGLVKRYAMTLVAATTLSAQSYGEEKKPKVSTEKVTDSIYMITGRGGNVGLFFGEDTTILIDDKFAPLAKPIIASVAEITDSPVEYLLNTHFHGDHTGGNEHFGKTGAIIVAHDNVRKTLSTGGEIKAFNSTFEAKADVGLPSITFNDRMVFHVNNETVSLQHYPSAHTDGDGVIYFEKENVIHAGDIFFNGVYPFVDIGNGGSVQGVISAVEKMLEKANGKTKIIPGHGPLSNRADLEAYLDMLKITLKRVADMKAQGLSRQEVLAKAPTADYDKTWNKGGIKANVWVSTLYSTLDE